MPSEERSTFLRLYNTLTRQKEKLVPLVPGHVNIYTCGPTVYDFAHIGNYRAFIFEDLLRRTIQLFGLSVTQVMNLTDVDDKTIRGALAQGISLDTYTEKYKKAFFEDLKTLRVQPAEKYPSATEYIEEMIEMIQTLLDKEVAYKGGDGSIYYSIAKFPEYGKLSHLRLDELKTGASQRVNSDEYDKERASDFVLWKAYEPDRDGNIYWESPYGKGRPGWHLECSTMAMKLLGETLDIHVGGIDNMFPHHENEIAQSEACSGKCFAHIWMHSDHLIVDNKKMSKSLGNFYTLRDLLNKGYSGAQIRYLLLHTHYRTQLNFTFEGLDAAQSSLQRVHSFIERLKEVEELPPETAVSKPVQELVEKTKIVFQEALGDDLNISAALAALFDLVHEGNSLCEQKQLGSRGAKEIESCLKWIDQVLDLLFIQDEEEIPQELQLMLEQRQKARADRDWKLSDQLRDQITERGYMIEDTKTSVRLKKFEKVKS